jgi:hypothetical protein
MRKLLVLLAGSLLLVTLAGSPALGAAKGTDRPWKASGSGHGIITPGTPQTFTIDGTSNNTHLGRGTFHLDAVCTPPDPGDCPTSTATFTIVAAHGDTLTASGANDTGTFTGGTGRFAGASGTVTTTTTSFVFDPSTLTFELTFTQTGTISY